MLSQSRKEECKKLLALLRDGKVKGIVTDFSVHSIIVLMDRFKKLEELKIFLLSLTAYKGLYVYAHRWPMRQKLSKLLKRVN